MIILTVNNLSFSFGTQPILDTVRFSVDEYDRCGVIGVNGAGKSTLFQLIANEYQPDEGSIQLSKGIKVAYFKQDNAYESSDTIGDAIQNVFSEVLSIESEMKALEEEISSLPLGPAQDALVRKHDNARSAYERADGYEYQSRVRGVMRGLNLGDGIGDSTPISILSGGQKTRLALALMLIKPPDLLLLDEPTNHLDIHSLEWLENYLKNYKRCFLVISHDRYFLDMVTTGILEVENHQITRYNGNYSYAVRKKAEDNIIRERHYVNQQREIERLEAYIEQQRRWNRERNIIAAESRQKALDRMEKVERPKAPPKKVKIKFRNTIVSSNDVLFIEGVSKSFGERVIFDNLTAFIKQNERVFIIGPNGCGKSTLLRILSGNLEPDGGLIEYGGRITFGYYDQEHFDLDDQNTVLDEVYQVDPDLSITDIRNTLAAFLFIGEDVFKKIHILSGGEKARVALVKLILSKAPMLLLDEPTNHLDINCREALEDALSGFQGTILVVSHDRYFIRKLATRILHFNQSHISDFPGDFTSYLKHIEGREDSLCSDESPDTGVGSGDGKPEKSLPGLGVYRDLEKQNPYLYTEKGFDPLKLQAISEKAARSVPATSNNRQPIQGAASQPVSQNKQVWQEAREKRSMLKKATNRLSKIESQIEETENRLAEIGRELVSDNVISDHTKLITLSTEQHELSTLLEELLAEWEIVSEQVAQIDQSSP